MVTMMLSTSTRVICILFVTRLALLEVASADNIVYEYENADVTVSSVNTCHRFMWKERPSSCPKILIPRGLCVQCARGAIFYDTGMFKDCTSTFEIEQPSCQKKLQEYANLNPCDIPRIEALSMYQQQTNGNGTTTIDEAAQEKKEEGRQVLDFLAHTFCEGGCDCIPMHGADRDQPEISIERGNCQAHLVTDVCRIWPELQVVALAQENDDDDDDDSSLPEGWQDWPKVCPLLNQWVKSSAARHWPSRAAVEVHSDVRNFADHFLIASEILEPSVYRYCYDLEVSQGNMEGITPFTTAPFEPTVPSPPTHTPPPTPFPTIFVQDRSNAIAIHRINCGAGSLTDHDGNVWKADQYFNTGRQSKQQELKITNVAANDNLLYTTNRWDPPGGKALQYTLPVEDPNVSHLVRLHFCEIFFLTRDSRIFDVIINDRYALKDYEIIQSAGAPFRAAVEEAVVPPLTATDDGSSSSSIQITFVSVFQNPIISGIEVFEVPAGTT